MRVEVKEESSSKHDVWGSVISMDAWDLEKIALVAERYVKRGCSVVLGGEKLKDLSELKSKAREVREVKKK